MHPPDLSRMRLQLLHASSKAAAGAAPFNLGAPAALRVRLRQIEFACVGAP